MVDELQKLTPARLAHRRNMVLNHFGRFEAEFDRRRSDNRILVRSGDIQ